jgi:hypothetical protein
MNWLANLALWGVKTFAPAQVGAVVTVDEAAIVKAIPDILAAEPQIKKVVDEIQIAAPHLLAAAKVLWPAFDQTLVMIDSHIAQGHSVAQAVDHAQRKIAAVAPKHVDAVEQWTREK